jgi:hypothetical protein
MRLHLHPMNPRPYPIDVPCPIRKCLATPGVPCKPSGGSWRVFRGGLYHTPRAETAAGMREDGKPYDVWVCRTCDRKMAEGGLCELSGHKTEVLYLSVNGKAWKRFSPRRVYAFHDGLVQKVRPLVNPKPRAYTPRKRKRK